MSSEKKSTSYLAHGVGRRKSSVARVYICEGNGKVIVNNREVQDYFPKGTDRYVVNQPMNLLKISNKYDVRVNVVGGGSTGQSGAIRLGVARALIKTDPTLRSELKKAGFLTRDSRKVERKKYGFAGARRSFQFSKR
ncbi:MAG: 30S ribosomal protein S9 [Halobacteriovoraceae bacterium]|nr:30S ribosomal protein S9 [Halobacteriovoraceae bacterium]